MKCVICNRETDAKGYCELHAKAYQNINERYVIWKEALETSWKEYLSEIVKNQLTGEWAREVAKYLIDSGEK